MPDRSGSPITRTWVVAIALGCATWIGSMGADIVANVVQHDTIPGPTSANALDSHAAAVFVGLASVPLLQRRRRAVVEAARLQDAQERLDEYRAAERVTAQARDALRARVSDCITAEAVTMFVQPISATTSAPSVVGYEALARFSDGRPPDVWFGEARDAGLSAELELLAVRLALELLPDIPDDRYLSVNVSPSVLVSEQFAALLRGHDGHRCVVELTEHLHVQSYDELQSAIQRLRRHGLRLAVDDAGAGFASFRHILQLGPDIIKLDRDLIRRCNVDFVRRTLAASLVGFAHEIGASLVAEGVETEEELEALRALGVPFAQGYHLGRPHPPAELRAGSSTA